MVVSRSKTVAGVNSLDAVLSFGPPNARLEGLIMDGKATTKLADFIPETSACHFHYLWDDQGAKVVAVSTSVNSEPKTWYFEEQSNSWEEIPPEIKTSAILVTSMAEDRKRLQAENDSLRKELATTRLDFELLRHDYERARQQIPQPKKKTSFSFFQKALLGLIFGMIFASLLPCASAQVTYTTQEQFKTTTTKNWQRETLDKFLEKTEIVWKTAIDFIENNWIQFVLTLWSHWIVHLCVFICVGWFKFDNITPTLILAFLALWSRWNLNAFLPLSAVDMGNLIAHCCTMFIYPLNDRLAFILMCSIMLGNILFCVLVGENPYFAITGAITVTACFFVNICCDHLGLPKGLPATFLVAYKIFYCVVFRPASVTIKDIDGKVIETTNISPKESRFAVLSKFRQMFQKRTTPRAKVEPFFNIAPYTTVVIKTPEGTGTGFRAGNYIVTAKHVLGTLDVCEVVHDGRTHASRVKYRHPTKDIVFLTLPPGLQDLKAFKVNKNWEDGTVAIIAKSGEFVHFAAAPAVQVGEEITYAVQTPDGSSGAPVIVPSGRVCGVHVVNTGFSAGAIMLTADDFPVVDSQKNAEVEKLRREIEELKKQLEKPPQEEVEEVKPTMEQCKLAEQDIIGLIREAVGKEILILRKELTRSEEDEDDEDEDDLPDFVQKKKGKNKKNRRRGARMGGPNSRRERKKAVWTEQEYQELLDKGFNKAALQDMADDIRERMMEEEQREFERRVFEDDDYNPYPDYEDEPDEQEANEIWFKQRFGRNSKSSKFSQIWYDDWNPPSPKIRPEHLATKFCVECSDNLIEKMSRKAKSIRNRIEAAIKFAVNNTNWQEDVDVALLLDQLSEMYYDLNEDMYVNDLPLFFQSKNSKRGPQTKTKRAPKSTK